MGLWSPFTTYGTTRGNALTPYSSCVFLIWGRCDRASSGISMISQPLEGEPVNFSGFFSGPPSGHVLGLLGGIIWGIGTVFNVVAGKITGFAISYAVGQSAPMVGALWGIFAWKEFKARDECKGLFNVHVRLLRARHSVGPRERLAPFLVRRSDLRPLLPFDPVHE